LPKLVKLLDNKKFTSWEFISEPGYVHIFNKDEDIASFSFKDLYYTYKIATKKERFKKKLLISSILASSLVILLAITYVIIYQKSSYDLFTFGNSRSIELIQTELKVKEEVDNYIHKVASQSALDGSELVDQCIKYDVDVIFTLAQGEIESHFGTVGMAAKTNSVWNAGAYDGFIYSDINQKYKFKHPNQSIKSYLNLLTNKYMINGRTEFDLMKRYTTHGGARYASSETYEQTLSSKYQLIKQTTQIDSLYKEYRNMNLMK